MPTVEESLAEVREAIAGAARRVRNGHPDNGEIELDDDGDVIGFGQREKCGGRCCGGDGPVRPPRKT